MSTTKVWYDEVYAREGFAAQRRYPNEELLRFMGRHFFGIDPGQRRRIAILEVGCGSGANLWMIAREGFDAYGLDLSKEALLLCQTMLKAWQTEASLSAGSMTAMPYGDGKFDAVIDIFSSYCIAEADFSRYLDEVSRLLKPGGRYFSYAPSKNSDAFTNCAPARKIDASTLDGLRRETSPYCGNAYPFRFIARPEYEESLRARGFLITQNEQVGRTYRNGAEYFEFVSIAAQKQ
jgi:cyclopropane fatty-acyl-phospholipid synthase-like methyltransferase